MCHYSKGHLANQRGCLIFLLHFQSSHGPFYTPILFSQRKLLFGRGSESVFSSVPGSTLWWFLRSFSLWARYLDPFRSQLLSALGAWAEAYHGNGKSSRTAVKIREYEEWVWDKCCWPTLEHESLGATKVPGSCSRDLEESKSLRIFRGGSRLLDLHWEKEGHYMSPPSAQTKVLRALEMLRWGVVQQSSKEKRDETLSHLQGEV